MTGRCKTCPHWNKPTSTCNHARSGDTASGDSMWAMSEIAYSELTTDLVSVKIQCGPDYGCIHHPENREKEPDHA